MRHADPRSAVATDFVTAVVVTPAAFADR